MTSLTMTAARNNISKVIDGIARRKEPVALTRRGKVVGGLVSAEDYEYLRRLRDEEDAEDVRESKKALEEYKRTGESYTIEEVKKKIGL